MRLILHQALRLERQRMADGGGGVAELDGNAGEGVAVDPVGGDRFHIAGGGLAERHALGPRADVPGHHRKEHPHAVAVEIVDHFLHAVQSARHVVEQVVLVAVIDADVRIDRPDQHRIDPAVTCFQIVEIAINRVLAQPGVV